MAGQNRQPDAFVESLGRFIDSHGLLRGSAGIVVAVSGGADSVTLLAAMRALANDPARAYRLTVAHLNHQLRQAGDDDARFVADLARRWQLPCVIGQADVRSLAGQLGQGIEQAGRMARYEFLLKTAGDCGADFVAVGHHADDNVETILYRIFRGTALRGLAGMPLSRPLLQGSQPSTGRPIMLVRPMLEFRRSELEDFCRRQDLAWRTDESNADTNYRRNFIRHELLDMLRTRLNPRVDEAVIRLARSASLAEEYLASQARQALIAASRPCAAGRVELDRRMLADMPVALRLAVVRLAMERLGVPMRSIGFDLLVDASAVALPDGPACVDLPGHCHVLRQGANIVIEIHHGGTAFPCCAAQAEKPAPPMNTRLTVHEQVVLSCPGTTSLGGQSITCQVMPFDQAMFDAHRQTHPLGVELLDADQVKGRLVCRRRRDGDAFSPLGAPGRQSVSNFLTNIKLPTKQRQAVWCVCDDLGIVYLAPLRIDERLKVSTQTTRILRITMRLANA